MNAPASSPNARSWTHGVVRACAAAAQAATEAAAAARAKATRGSEPTTPTTGIDDRSSVQHLKEAIAHGYGPYRSGVDPEYDWYIDREHDGIDCER